MNLAVNGGNKSIGNENEYIFHWPIITDEDIAAVVEVLKAGTMSGTSITKQFEKEYAEYFETKYALGFCNGTASLLASMWAVGLGAGDELITASMSYWASAAPALMLGAKVNFCDINRNTLCINPCDIEHRIGPDTKAILVTHYAGYPCPMDEIMEIAHKHNLKVIEDVSHAHGGLYHGRRLGSIGDISAMSLMAGKGFAIGEAGMIVTSDRELYERAISFAHYERTGIPSKFNPVDNQLSFDYLKRFSGIPLGAAKGRMNQTCSALGRVQLKYFNERIKEIQNAMDYFWDSLANMPGLKPHRVVNTSENSMGCWYYPQGLYYSEELDGLSSADFCKAIQAEGIHWCFPGGNSALHTHPFFNESDVFHLGKPTSIAFGGRDVRQHEGDLPISESIHDIAIAVPWFKHFNKNEINKYVSAFKKVIEFADSIPRSLE